MIEQIKKYSKILLIAFQFILICFLVFKNCDQKVSLAENLKTIEEYKNNQQEFEKTVNKQNQQLATQQQHLISKDKDIERELLKNSNLKKLNEQIKIQTETKIKNITAQYESDLKYCLNSRVDTFIVNGDTTIRTKTDTVGVAFGSSIKYEDSWLKLKGKIQKEGVKFDSISVKNSYTITIGKGGLKKGFKTYVELKNDNPYTNTISLGNVKVVEEKKWYQNGWLKFGAGLLIGSAGILYLTK